MRAGQEKIVVLTGDRPTGKLHLGHYVGSLANRLEIQSQPKYQQFIMLADIQALTDNFDNPEKVRSSVHEVVLDYLAIGIDPQKTTIFIQSCIPEIAELTIFYLNLVTVNRLKRNPTVKAEIQARGFGENLPAGFFVYPISQAADITFCKAQLVPVGEDQIPMIEQTNEIVRTFNRIYNSDVLVEAQALVPKQGARLPGIDGSVKMSKSAGNAIYLDDDRDTLWQKVRSMYTDPKHIHVSDPGTVEGNVVFTYLDIFDSDKVEVERLKQQYRSGGLGDMVLKKRLFEILDAFLSPLRERRARYAQEPEYITRILQEGVRKTRVCAQETMQQIRKVMKLDYNI